MIQFRHRFRFWDYPGGVTVEIPVDEPDAEPPARLEDVPAHWPRTVGGRAVLPGRSST